MKQSQLVRPIWIWYLSAVAALAIFYSPHSSLALAIVAILC